jgi:outer membrane protein assembly factor BamD
MHEVHVAQYYYKRGAYVAAVNRAQYALKTYPQAPANEMGIAIMVRSYDALGTNDLRDDALRVLKLNFPKSKYITGNFDKTKPWWRFWEL